MSQEFVCFFQNLCSLFHLYGNVLFSYRMYKVLCTKHSYIHNDTTMKIQLSLTKQLPCKLYHHVELIIFYLKYVIKLKLYDQL